MTRSLSGGFSTAMAAAHANAFPLLELQFASGTDYICGLAHDVVYNANTYLAAGGCLGLEQIVETATQTEGLKISLAGAPSANVALALSEKVQGRLVILRLAMIDSGGALVVDDNVWTGLMDVFTLQDDANQCVAVITAEHMLAVWDRPRTVRYTDAQQQILFPGDLGFQYVEEMAEASIVWPGKEFFQV
jgi:hypothetical protein